GRNRKAAGSYPAAFLFLPGQDSNLDKENQNPLGTRHNRQNRKRLRPSRGFGCTLVAQSSSRYPRILPGWSMSGRNYPNTSAAPFWPWPRAASEGRASDPTRVGFSLRDCQPATLSWCGLVTRSRAEGDKSIGDRNDGFASAVEWLAGAAESPTARWRSLSVEGRTYRGTASVGGCRGRWDEWH